MTTGGPFDSNTWTGRRSPPHASGLQVGELSADLNHAWDGQLWQPVTSGNSIMTIGSAASGVTSTHTFPAYPEPDPPPSLLEMLAMRMRVSAHTLNGGTFDFVCCYQADTNDKVFVFVVNMGQAVTLEDDPDLFPSDKLITQLRLLK